MENSAAIVIQKRAGGILASITAVIPAIRWKANIAAQNATSAIAVISTRKSWIRNVFHATAMMMNIAAATESNAGPVTHPKLGKSRNLTTTTKQIFHCVASTMK